MVATHLYQLNLSHSLNLGRSPCTKRSYSAEHVHLTEANLLTKIFVRNLRNKRTDAFWVILNMRRWLVLLALTLSVACLGPLGQRDALVSLYNVTNGEFWSYYRWNLSSEPCDTPTWPGLTCTGANVTKIYLAFNNMTGTLPDLDMPWLRGL